jgi:hypothetical protein
MVAGAVMWPRDVSTAPIKGRDSEAPTARPGGGAMAAEDERRNKG